MSPPRAGTFVAALGIVLLLFAPPGPTAPATDGTGPAAPPPPPLPSAPLPPHPAFASDPAIAGAGIGRLLVTNHDPAATPNSGLEVNLTGFRVEPFPADSSLQVGVDEVVGPYLASFGLFQHDAAGAYPFFSLFNNTTGIPEFQANESSLRVAPGDACDFELMATGGTNWTLYFNGVPFGGINATSRVDLRAALALDAGGITFSVIALAVGEVVPSTLDVPTAMGVLRPAGWFLPMSANVTYRGDASVDWGIAGRSQNAQLYPGELRTGTSLPIVTNGSLLWTTAPVPVDISIGSNPGYANGTGTTLLEGNVTVGGTPLDGFPIALRDTAGGTFLPTFPVSDTTGAIRSEYVAPNVTVAATDRITATSRCLGALGVGTAEVTVSPAVAVVLSTPGLASLPPGGSEEFQVVAHDALDRPIPGLLVQFSIVGLGNVQPLAGITGASGELTIAVAATSTTPFSLFIVVSEPGYWGRLRVTVAVATPTPSLWAQLQPYLAEIAIAALLGVAVALYLRRRLPKSPMRPMPLREAPTAPAAPAAALRPDPPPAGRESAGGPRGPGAQP